MRKGLDQLEGLKDDGIRYAKLRWASLRLTAAEKMSTLVGKAIGYVVFFALLIVALVFLMLGLALWLGEVMGHPWCGFIISGAVFLIAAVIVFLLRNRLMVNSLVRSFVDLFFSSNLDSDGTPQ